MKCKTCGANNFDDAKYCTSCGATITRNTTLTITKSIKKPHMHPSQRSILSILGYVFLFTSGALFISRFFSTVFSLDPTNQLAYMLLNSITNLTLYLGLIALVFIFLYYELKVDFLKLKETTPKTTFNRALETLGVLYVAGIIGNLILLILGIEGTSGNQMVIEMLLRSPYAILIIITAVFFGPFVEEAIFRVAGFAIFPKSVNPNIIILITALLFGFIHVAESQDYIMIIPYFFQGIALGYVYSKYKNFYVVFIGHALYNLVAVILTYIS